MGSYHNFKSCLDRFSDILLRSTKSFRENLAYSMAVLGRDSRNHSQLLREADIRKVYVYKFGKTALVEENAFNKNTLLFSGLSKSTRQPEK